MRRGILVIVPVVLLLAACGGGSGGGTSNGATTTTPRLSASEYRAHIAKIKAEATAATRDETLALQARSVPELGAHLDAFAFATNHLGDEVAKLNPPANAEAANTQLAKGMHDISHATHAASVAVAKLRTAQAGIAYLEKSGVSARGARELNQAIAKLKQLGYTN